MIKVHSRLLQLEESIDMWNILWISKCNRKTVDEPCDNRQGLSTILKKRFTLSKRYKSFKNKNHTWVKLNIAQGFFHCKKDVILAYIQSYSLVNVIISWFYQQQFTCTKHVANSKSFRRIWRGNTYNENKLNTCEL